MRAFYRLPAFLTAVAILGAVAATAIPRAQQQPVTVRLRDRTMVIDSSSTSAFLIALRASSRSATFGMAHVRRSPTANDRQLLDEHGLHILEYLANGVYNVRATRNFSMTDTVIGSRIVALALPQPGDKVHPEIWTRRYAGFAGTGEAGPANYVVNSDSTLNLVVHFHSGVSLDEADAMLSGRTVERYHASGAIWSVVTTDQDLRAMAADDRVWWIGPATVGIGRDNDVGRHTVKVSAVQSIDFSTGWTTGITGDGVQVGVFDWGIDDNHVDFSELDAATGAIVGSRMVTSDPAADPHGTHVAGIVAGNGRGSAGNDSWGQPNGGSPYQWRGIAPRAELVEASTLGFDGCPATLIVPMAQMTSYKSVNGMDLSNHSYWISFEGEYTENDQIHDAVIRGDDIGHGPPGPARLHVQSAGNSGLFPNRAGTVCGVTIKSNQHGYFSLGTQVKNALVVGSYDAQRNTVSAFSSLGPTSDGRIKPDVVAPGGGWDPLGVSDVTVVSSAYCDASTSNFGYCQNQSPPSGYSWPLRDGYDADRGTSMAAPVATGVMALALEAYAQTYNVDLSVAPPLPSTLRAIAIHSARDLISPEDDFFTWPFNLDGMSNFMRVRAFRGPDFTTGWGLIDANAAVRTVRSRKIIESTIDVECQVRTFDMYVAGGFPYAAVAFRTRVALPFWYRTPMKVTLAWDDPPSLPAGPLNITNPKLVNDLDLVLIDPNGNKHYPWLLDQVIKDSPTGPVLSDDDQACGMNVTVEQRLNPTITPQWNFNANVPIENDPIQESDLQQAGRGKDHLNNVEQVSIWGVPGRWQVQVSGFRLPQGPQSFSLVGVFPRITIPVEPQSICIAAPGFCQRVLRELCERFPPFCQGPSLFSFIDDSLHASFRAPEQPVIMPFHMLCHYTAAELCTPANDRLGYELTIGSNQPGFEVEIYSRSGLIVDRAAADSGKVTLSLPPTDEEQIVVIRPPDDLDFTRPLRLSVQVDVR